MSFKDYCKLIFLAAIVLMVIITPPLIATAILYFLQASKLTVMIAAFGVTFFSLFAGVWLIDRIGNSDNIWKE